jgi:hypothetical protein
MENRPTRAHIKYTKESLSKVHNHKYDYSKYIYYGAEKLSIFICPIHGDFEQSPYSHLKGFGCKKCGIEKARDSKFKSLEEFIQNSHKIHGLKYDYSKVNYVRAKIPVEIICKVHGNFMQTPDIHLRGSGCPSCSLINSGLNRRGNTQNFIRRAIELHGDLFDYSEVNYIKNNIKVKIKCKNGHEFYQTPANHLTGYGCNYCQISPLHQFLHNNLGGVLNNRDVLNGKEIDLYFPDKKIAFEVNGVYFHSSDFLPKNYHQEKVDIAAEKGISLFHIWYDKNTDFNLILSWAKSKLGLITQKVYARNTIIKTITAKEYRDFLEKTHLQGFAYSKVKYGLFHKDELVSVIGFSFRSGSWVLERFSSKTDTIVIGGFSKLLSHFIKENSPSEIVTYSDFSYSDGSVYSKNGFTKDLVSEGPRLYYTDGVTLENRRKFQRKNVKARNPEIKWGSEKSMAKEEGFVPLYGCKTVKWLLKN